MGSYWHGLKHSECMAHDCPENCGKGRWQIPKHHNWVTDSTLNVDCSKILHFPKQERCVVIIYICTYIYIYITESFFEFSIAVECHLGQWSVWTACTVICGNGMQQKRRYLVSDHGTRCSSQPEKVTKTCTRPKCPGNYSIKTLICHVVK